MLLKFLFKFKFYQSFFQFIAFASTAGGLRTCDGAQFASLEKYATHFSNPDFVRTEPNNAPYTGTGESANNKLKSTFLFQKRGNRFIDPHSYQYLQKRLINFGTAEGGMGLMAKPYQTQKVSAAPQMRGKYEAMRLEQSVSVYFKRG
jgi:hypothetical protein